MRRTANVLALVVVAGVALAGCGAAPGEGPERDPITSPAAPRATPAVPSSSAAAVESVGEPRAVATGLAAPWSVAFLGTTALISERDSADVRELLDDGSTRVVGTIEGVSPEGEGGLLGLAVDDDGRLYAYSTGAGGNRVQRIELTGEPGSLGLGQAETILDGIPSASFHDGGRIAFGPDGMLYVTTGDAGDGDAAQDLDSLAGKILRMTPDGDVPDDNPFDGSLVLSYGHRNPQGIDWADDGTMFASEFGQNTWDELNVITPGGNYGWPVVEGVAGDERYVDPVQQWSPAEASPSGIEIIGGTIFVANLRGAVLRAVPVAQPSESAEYYAGEFGRLRDVTASPDGDLWFLTNNTDGRGDPGPDDDRLMAVAVE
ncbi:PQQ-dependent sugar dehydrogenase [Myceligenerans pegani]|uniref:PQQ-dependent sugar dehydrogenase n=1 Tax=Myceligenerans pegani TaxID=2776917 RepID=A0ABR9N3J2_9MICO|nr:PQQ-dependent sugar dehydrogenase [Myceligenerans sp. TRM 65318]MBE1877673.1 PQQ-dependent sugar dehydrogenase [Myceligenerans sp. TRM 65318]MBE3019944.1 PQQ-dependent sugar dehydrogenase [Myceligenerans sp. TRM 65318]